MSRFDGVAPHLAALMMAASVLTGCSGQVAETVFSPLISASRASQTPESVGVTTSNWRGKSCKDLELSYGFMSEEQRKSAASADSQMAKINGWQLDAINQVRTEQGCIQGASGVKVPANGQVTAYGYCFAGDDRHHDLTPVFTYGDYYADNGDAESAAFKAMLTSTYGFKGTSGACFMEDSPAHAQAAIDRLAKVTNLQLYLDTVRVAWTPPPMVKASTAAVAAAPLTTPGKTTNTQPAAGSSEDLQSLGLVLEAPSPELIKALGLKDTSGAWVVNVAPGSAAAKAGIKPMDVIQDLSGQVVNAPDDVHAIAGKLRAGYRATVGIWRERGNRELALVIPTGAAAPVAMVKAQPVAVAPVPATSTIAAAQATVPGAKPFCHAYIYVVKKPGGWQSPIFQTTTDNQTPAVMMSSLSAFVAKVRHDQLEKWRPFTFPAIQCATNVGYCFANGEKSLFKADQMAGQFCFASRAEAETHVASFNSVTPVYEMVDFKP